MLGGPYLEARSAFIPPFEIRMVYDKIRAMIYNVKSRKLAYQK
jgi:hypothetical protein